MKIKVIVHPSSKRPRIITDLLQNTHVYVREPAIEGRANNAVIEALAKHYKLSKSKIVLRYGVGSKIKLFEISGTI